MARIAVAALHHETNTFAPLATRQADFEEAAYEGGTRRGGEVFDLVGGPMPAGGFIARAQALGHEIVPLVCAYAEPGGLIERSCFEALSAEIVAALAAALPVDAVYLDLHGAMSCAEFDDADAEVVARIRAVVGDAPIVSSFDLHGNLTDDSLEQLDLAIAFRTYPHIDAVDTGRRVADLLDRRLKSGAGLHRAFRKIPFLIPLDRQCSLLEPARTLYDELASLEQRAGVWSVSLMMGFIQSDTPIVGPSIFAYGDDAVAVDRAVDSLHAMVVAREADFHSVLISPAAAAEMAATWQSDRPLIIADVQDNAGGGASSDVTDMIRALVAAGARDVAIGMIHDPIAVARAHQAGAGATIRLALGGRGTAGDTPFEAEFEVVRLNDGPVRATGEMAQGQMVDLGRTALLSSAGIELVVTSRRTQCLDRAYFRHLGVDLENRRAIVVKSSVHFRADFSAIAGEIIGVAGLGMSTADPAAIPYTRLPDAIRILSRQGG